MITPADVGRRITIDPTLNHGFAEQGTLLAFGQDYPACYLVKLDNGRILYVYREDGITLLPQLAQAA